jgi:hypothetical protein
MIVIEPIPRRTSSKAGIRDVDLLLGTRRQARRVKRARVVPRSWTVLVL